MKRILQWTVIGLGAVVLLLIIVVTALSVSTTVRLNRTYTVHVQPIAIPTDEAAVTQGERLARVLCIGCHGGALEGKVIFDDPLLARVTASNLTAGNRGIGALYRDEDWIRSIRHGVGPTQHPLFIMPAGQYNYLSDADLGNLIAYLRTLPPVDNDLGQTKITLLGRALIAVGAFGDIINAETIDHDIRPNAVAPGTMPALGEYLVNISGCRTCHGRSLAGGKDPDPEAPPGPNLTLGGELAGWSEADFVRAIRSGQTPDGRQLRPEFMPWPQFSQFTDVELHAIWRFLLAQPALATVPRP
jgi:mono/diheme cytochrome c family protein